MSIEDYKYIDGGFQFVFDPEPIDSKEDHVLVPMVLNHNTYFGLCFVDCNDMRVLRAKNKMLFLKGTTKEHTMTDNDFVLLGNVRDLVNDGAHFDKPFK